MKNKYYRPIYTKPNYIRELQEIEDRRIFEILDAICGVKPKDKGIVCKKRKK